MNVDQNIKVDQSRWKGTSKYQSRAECKGGSYSEARWLYQSISKCEARSKCQSRAKCEGRSKRDDL